MSREHGRYGLRECLHNPLLRALNGEWAKHPMDSAGLLTKRHRGRRLELGRFIATILYICLYGYVSYKSITDCVFIRLLN